MGDLLILPDKKTTLIRQRSRRKMKSVIEMKKDDKKYILQFLPERLSYLKNSDTIIYQEKTLKSKYLIDIIHNVYMKYYFNKENFFYLNSLVFKEKYGKYYNYYLNYLLDNYILILEREYIKGNNSRAYSINKEMLSEKVDRYKNNDSILVKKYKQRYNEVNFYNYNNIRSDIKEKLINDLYLPKVDKNKSIFYLSSLNEEEETINRNIYSVESINDSHIFYHFDKYGRMHSNYTILKTFIRKNCLTINGEELIEFDIPNSQPMFLLSIIRDYSYISEIDIDELNLFKYLIFNKLLYKYLCDKLGFLDKKDAKKMLYKVLFGKNKNSNVDKIFNSLFPTIHLFIKKYKEDKGDYRSMAYELQYRESELIYNNIISDIMKIDNNIPIITIHDSIMTTLENKDVVGGIFYEKLFTFIEDLNK